ncbi:DUF4846 domain-containing protein [soil metagenome]
MFCGLFFWLKAGGCDYIHMAVTYVESPVAAMSYKRVGEIPTPMGFARTAVAANGFGDYLRQLPLKQGDNKVYLYNGEEKGNQNAHWAVVDIDTGDKNLQQCADVTMRLWGEYLYKQKRYNDIKFNFLSDGKPRYFKDYAKGDYTYPTFRKYMDWVFNFANTASLFHELKTVELKDLQVGDIFIFKGVPIGHAVIVADMAENTAGEKMFMLVQGYMPAQDMHILNNPNDHKLSPWYSTNYGDALVTPEFVFDDYNGYKIKRYGN